MQEFRADISASVAVSGDAVDLRKNPPIYPEIPLTAD
jgi:hypothetical protein